MKIFNPEKFRARPAAILLDIDNTLYAYAPAHAAAWKAVRDKLRAAHSLPLDDFDRAASEARLAVKERLGPTAASHSRLLYLQRTLEAMGLGSHVLVALDLEQTYWRNFMANAALFDGVSEFLDDARLAQIPVVAVTDLTAQIQFRKLVYWEIGHLFEYVVTSEEAGFDKPHEAPFRIALEKLGLNGRPVDGAVWMIGDDAEKDVIGARNAIGAATIQKLHRGVAPGRGPAAPDASFESFSNLRESAASLLTRPLSAENPSMSG